MIAGGPTCVARAVRCGALCAILVSIVAATCRAEEGRRGMALARMWDDVALARNRFRRELTVLARMARDRGDVDLLLAALREIAAHSPADVETRMDLALAELGYGFPEKARGTFLSITNIDPEESRALRHLAVLAEDEGQAKQAAELRRRADLAKPRNEKAHMDAARHFMRQFMEDETHAEWQRVLAIYPDHSSYDRTALISTASQAVKREDYTEAARHYERILGWPTTRNMSPQSESYYRRIGRFYRGLAFSDQGKDRLAAEAFDAAIRECRQNASYVRQLGDWLFQKRLYRRAAAAYERALALRPPGKASDGDKGIYDVLPRQIEAARRMARFEKPRRKLSEDELQKWLGSFGKVLCLRVDPHANARWAAIEGVFVWRDDEKSLHVEPFVEFRAAWDRPINANAIAFSQGHVWAATSVGLMCFDRASGQWTQRVIANRPPDTPVRHVQFEDGRVLATVGDGTYALDLATWAWSNVEPK